MYYPIPDRTDGILRYFLFNWRYHEGVGAPQVIPPDSMMQRRAAGMRYFLFNPLLNSRNFEVFTIQSPIELTEM